MKEEKGNTIEFRQAGSFNILSNFKYVLESLRERFNYAQGTFIITVVFIPEGEENEEL